MTLGGFCPTKLLLHGLNLDGLKIGRTGEELERLLDGPFDTANIGVLENDAGAFGGGTAPMFDSISQSSGGSYDGQGPVSHGIKLIKATRFEATRHQEEVGTRFDAMRETIVVADPHCTAFGEIGGEPAKLIFKLRISATQ